MRQKLETLVASSMMLFVTLTSYAEDSAEGVSFTPAIDVARYNDSNVYTTSTGETASSITTIAPSIALDSANGLGLKYAGEYSKYSHSSNDNYQDHNLSLQANLKPSRKINFKFRGNYVRGHDAVGSTASGSVTPDKWNQSGLGAQVNFGVEGARGNLLFEVVKDSKRYTTNPAQTAALEKDDLFTAAALSFRIWPKSSLFFRAEQTGINYGTRNADNMLSRYFAGIKWDASGKTSGSIKIGSATKNFSDDSVHQDHSGSNWSATVRWVPVERSRITLTTDRGFYDTTGGSDDVIDRKHQSIKWDYAWSSRVKSDINYKYGSDGYSGLSGTNRSDRISSYSMNVNYQMGRYWTVGMGYSNDRRDSNINSYDYTKKISMIHVNASL